MNTFECSTTEYLYECDQQQYNIPKYDSSSLMNSVSPFYSTSPSASPDLIYSNETFSFSMNGPGSPDSFSTAPIYPPPQLVQSSSTSTTASAAYLNETIAKASALPESFYPEFLQYSKESFEQPSSKKRSRSVESSEEEDEEAQKRASPLQKTEQDVSVSEMRRQIHIQSEQKRRAQIKDGFEDLRAELPTCLNKKMSKVTLLHKTVQHIKHLKSTQAAILAELQRLVQDNEQLRNFQQSILQKQALENMYTIGNI